MATPLANCPRFVQNAWKKDMCSNCFKPKEEHTATQQNSKPIPSSSLKMLPPPAKSIIKATKKSNKKKSVNFPKEVSEVIGYGGEWSGSDGSDYEDNVVEKKPNEEVKYEDDENLVMLTKTNTEFNMNNGNLLGDPATNIKRSFAALKLGAPQKDSAGKKQTLKISVTPFGGAAASTKLKVAGKEESNTNSGVVLKSVISTSDETSSKKPAEPEKSPDFEVKIGTEKSLLEEISETLLSKRIVVSESSEKTQIKSDIIQNSGTSSKASNVDFKSSQDTKVTLNSNASIEFKSFDVSKSSSQLQSSSDAKSSYSTKSLIFPKGSSLKSSSDLKNSQDSYDISKSILRSEMNDLTEKTSKGFYEVNKIKTESSKDFSQAYKSSTEISKSILNLPKITSESMKSTIEIPKLSQKIEHSSLSKNDVIKVEIKNHDSITSAVISTASDSSTNAGKRPITRGTAILKDMEKPKVQVLPKNTESDNSSDLECGATSDYYDVVDTYTPVEESKDSLLQKKSHYFSNTTISDMFLAHQPITEAIKKRGESYNLMDTSYVTSKITDDGLIVTKSHLHEDALDSTGSSFDSSSSDEDSSKPKILSSNSSDYEDIQVIDKALKNRCEPDGRSDPDGSSETSPAPALPQNPPPQQSFLHSAKPKVPTKPVTVNIVKPFQKRNAEIIMQLQQVINKEKSLSSDSLDVLKSPKKTRAPNPPENDFGDEEPIMSFKEIAQVKNKFAVKTNTVQLKEPRTYPSINPKFRSLNHLNKSHEAQEKIDKFERLQSPEPAPRHSLSLSQDSLNMDIDKVKKKKFSIKKFLRMGTSKTESASKKDYSHYADIPTSPSDSPCAPQVKPRLIIIHPLDINNTGVEVVGSPSPDTEKAKQITHKPPAPPVRADSTKLESAKPSRPPPPKNNEFRVELEQQLQQQKGKAPSPPGDTVYANLGEVRNAIAPRKPERTNSMREREAKALELQRRQPVGETTDEQCKSEEQIITKPTSITVSPDSFNERKKKIIEIENVSTRSKIELFESGAVSKSPSPAKLTSTYFINNDGIKSSVQKMNVTIDNYLKNKKLISASDTNLLNNASRSPTPPQIVASTSQEIPRNYSIRNSASNVSNIELRTNGSYEPIAINGNGKMQRSSYPEHVLQLSGAVPRTAMSYCGSEIGESEIYSPYSFCGSEAGDLMQGDITDGYQTTSRSNKTVSRLKMRKGRSVVHTNLEDNYSAVIVANHEALAQVLEQLQQPPMIPAPLRPIANCINLRFDDFMIIDSIGLVIGKSVFHQAVWQNSVPVTLVLTSDSNQMVSGVCSELNQMSGGVSGALKLITEFCDLVPNNYLPSMPTTKLQMVQATITVLPKLHVETLEAMSSMIKSKTQNQSLFGGLNTSGTDDDQTSSSKSGLFDDLLCREVGFIMLQLVNGLKMMQAKGVEEMPLSLSNIIMCREMEKETQARLCILQGINLDLSTDEDDEMATLCQCALKVVKDFLPETKLTPILSQLLAQERADTLSKIKSVLEYVLWGPSDVPINGPIRERETTLQRWLDLSRATALRSLAGNKIDLTIYDECHLIFLIRSNSKTMLDASQVIANFNTATV